jgi:hypothetical protein
VARRNPLNARYQKNTAPAGKTRKSAAAAKPSRSDHAPAKSASSSSKGSSAGKKPSVLANPDTPEFRYWRRIWWVLVASALALTLASFALLSYAHQRTASNIVLGFAYGAIFMTFFVDWYKIRPMRKGAYEAAKSGKPAKASDKPAEKPEQASKSDNKLAEKTAGETESDTEGRA